MTTRLIALIAVCLFTVCSGLSAQKFAKSYDTFSRKKPVHVVLKAGTELDGDLKKVTRKRGNVTYIEVETADGKEHKLPAAKIAQFYAAPSGIEKVANILNMTNGEGLFDPNVESARIKDGYMLLESVRVRMSKKKTVTLLLQLANPEFSKDIKIYHYAGNEQRTGSMTLPGITGTTNSFFVKVGSARTATLLHKARYKKEFKGTFKGCDAVLAVKSPKWKNFADHALLYSENCGEAVGK